PPSESKDLMCPPLGLTATSSPISRRPCSDQGGRVGCGRPGVLPIWQQLNRLADFRASGPLGRPTANARRRCKRAAGNRLMRPPVVRYHPPRMPANPVVVVDRIRKVYGRVVAVDDVSFEVRQGEIFGLIGPNGAGKTTTMECVEGLRRPDQGRISVLGLDPARDAAALHRRIGVQLQEA